MMKELWNKLDGETKLGGVFGFIAIIAIIVEVALGGFSAEAIAGGIKDIAGTLVAVFVFIFAVHQIKEKKEPLSFEERFTLALDKWCESNRSMISKKENDKLELFLKVNAKNYYNDLSTDKEEGRFAQFSTISEENYNKPKTEIKFYMNETTFLGKGHGKSKEQCDSFFNELGSLFCKPIYRKFADFADVSNGKKVITVTIKNPIITDEDIDRFIDLINTMYQAYLVAAKIKL